MTTILIVEDEDRWQIRWRSFSEKRGLIHRGARWQNRTR